PSPSQTMGPIMLPAIQPPAKGDSRSKYTLPPVSALEELWGVDTQDSAAVLPRLQSDDDDTYSKSGRDTVDQDWRGWRALSTLAPKYACPSSRHTDFTRIN
ncbi:hypothetical protein B0H10DRAFT_1800467, partial [Mycena sp. CBHHK59/15]